MGTLKFTDIELKHLVRKGLSLKAMATHLGVSKSTVCVRLKALNIAVSRDVTIRSARKIVDREINALDQLQKINRDANELLDLCMHWNRGDGAGTRSFLLKPVSGMTRLCGDTETRSFRLKPVCGLTRVCGEGERGPEQGAGSEERAGLSTEDLRFGAGRSNCPVMLSCTRHPQPANTQPDNSERSEGYRFRDPRELALKVMAEIRGQLKLQLEMFQALFDMRAVQQFQTEVLEIIENVSPEARDEIVRRLAEKNALRSSLDLDQQPKAVNGES